jgi:hypothetical protein
VIIHNVLLAASLCLFFWIFETAKSLENCFKIECSENNINFQRNSNFFVRKKTIESLRTWFIFELQNPVYIERICKFGFSKLIGYKINIHPFLAPEKFEICTILTNATFGHSPVFSMKWLPENWCSTHHLQNVLQSKQFTKTLQSLFFHSENTFDHGYQIFISKGNSFIAKHRLQHYNVFVKLLSLESLDEFGHQ